MAKKRRIIQKEPEEEYEFVPPEFNEKEFILKDIYGTKILLVVAALAIIVGILCACLQRFALANNLSSTTACIIGLVLLFLGTFVLKKLVALFRFKVDMIEGKSWLGNYILFLLLGLGVWILMINAPFY